MKRVCTLHKKLASIKEDETALSGLKMMTKENVSALAILNGDGELVGNLSSKCLKISPL